MLTDASADLWPANDYATTHRNMYSIGHLRWQRRTRVLTRSVRDDAAVAAVAAAAAGLAVFCFQFVLAFECAGQ